MGRHTLQHQLAQAQAGLDLLYQFSTALTATLKLEETLYITLTAVTAHQGLGFTRAMIFLREDGTACIRGRMAMDAAQVTAAQCIWSPQGTGGPALEDLLTVYHQFRRQAPTPLDQEVRRVACTVDAAGRMLATPLREGEPLTVVTRAARSRLQDALVESLHLDAFVAVPLMGRDGPIGVLVVDRPLSAPPIRPEEIQLLTMLANQAGLAIENASLYERLWRSAKTDALTRLWNHGYFQQALENELRRARRSQHPVSLSLFDLDHFKQYNDAWGHQAGDQVLRELAQALRIEARSTDLVARYAGEEFVCIFPQTTKAESVAAAERMRTAVMQVPFHGESVVPGGRITVSCGVSTFPDDAHDGARLIYVADMALYAAKHAGRNRVAAATPSGLPLVAQRNQPLIV